MSMSNRKILRHIVGWEDGKHMATERADLLFSRLIEFRSNLVGIHYAKNPDTFSIKLVTRYRMGEENQEDRRV